jgi:tRNA pseudouridine32 synthase/23S rRNA pseudouridine746 synthase/23S rRNA pseudouridine1911/1915/1917 synthase
MATLLDHLQELFPDSSKTTLRKMLQDDRVLLNGAIARDARTNIAARDRVEIVSKAARRLIDSRIALLHEDEDLIVINKAAGLLTVASPDERRETAEALLDSYLGAHHGKSRIHVVHRLDRDSSGVLVFAKNSFARDRLQALFAEHDIERIYSAIVHGRMTPATGSIRSWLAEDREKRVRSVADGREGKLAVSHYITVRSGTRFTLLDVTLETGRRNQIRVHLAESGHPIVGDAMYGKGLADPLGRLALHARHLAFVHPRTRARLAFTVDLPQPMARLEL